MRFTSMLVLTISLSLGTATLAQQASAFGGSSHNSAPPAPTHTTGSTSSTSGSTSSTSGSTSSTSGSSGSIVSKGSSGSTPTGSNGGGGAPEPASMLLLAVGGGIVGLKKFKNRKNNNS